MSRHPNLEKSFKKIHPLKNNIYNIHCEEFPTQQFVELFFPFFFLH